MAELRDTRGVEDIREGQESTGRRRSKALACGRLHCSPAPLALGPPAFALPWDLVSVCAPIVCARVRPLPPGTHGPPSFCLQWAAGSVNEARRSKLYSHYQFIFA